jgi:hypothetical protein
MPLGPRARHGLAGLVCAVTFLLACGTDVPTQVGKNLRANPDTVHVQEIRTVKLDSVFYLPVSLGRSPTAQVGRRGPYTAHILYDFSVPTRVVQGSDTLHLDIATLVVKIDSLATVPFTGSMRIGLREVAASGRYWAKISTDSVIDVPEFGVSVARDTVVAGPSLVKHPPKLSFAVDLTKVTRYAKVAAAGDTLDFNVALAFQSFEAPGPGFFEYPYLIGSTPTARFIGFSNAGPDTAFETLGPVQHRVVVAYDSTYSLGTRLAVSDGHRLHAYLRFEALRKALPESAAVHLAELVLTQVDSLNGLSFGTGPQIGAIAPTDSTKIFDMATNLATLAFPTTIVANFGAQVTMSVSGFAFGMQEGSQQDNGFLLRLSNEGTKVRHIEFYGPATADTTLRPFLRVLYSLPTQFERGER